MSRMSENRKAELQHRYGDNSLAPIPEKYMEAVRAKSARYMLFANHDNRHGYCEHCAKDITFDKTKHKAKIVCPNCGTELTVQHTWRAKCKWNVNWGVVGQVLDNDTFALRYIMVNQHENYIKEVSEKAREIYDFKHGWSYIFSNLESGWTVNARYYFTEFNMGYYRRNQCCIGAESINNIKAELKKLPVMKYFTEYDRYFSVYTYARDNVSGLLNASLYEKLEKVGLGNIAKADYEDYYSPKINYRRKETSLVKMLGLNKLQYNLLLKNGSKQNLNFIRNNKEMPIQILDYIFSHDAFRQWEMAKSIKEVNPVKAMKYMVKNHVSASEYNHYIWMLIELKYKLDNSYLYPKDFRKADNRVTDEWNMKQDDERAKAQTKNSRIIKEISDGLKQMKDLAEFMDGSKGLLVYVPESAKDLITEGRKLHNCLGSYVDRVAENKTLIFFVRKVDDPTAPFVAFEYVNGEVVQCRYDHNENVKDTKIINFVDAFTERLRQNKVMVA